MTKSRLDALVHYVCARCDDPRLLGATKLNKVLWYADVIAYQVSGISITGAAYVKRQFGPVPKGIESAKSRLASEGAIVERPALHFGHQQRQIVPLLPADISMFTAQEISIVDEVLDEICRNHTAASIGQATRDIVWEAAEIGEEIPLYAVFAGNAGELDEDDMAWARAQIEEIEMLLNVINGERRSYVCVLINEKD